MIKKISRGKEGPDQKVEIEARTQDMDDLDITSHLMEAIMVINMHLIDMERLMIMVCIKVMDKQR